MSQDKNLLWDFKLVCDETNNDDESIKNGHLYIDIEVPINWTVYPWVVICNDDDWTWE